MNVKLPEAIMMPAVDAVTFLRGQITELEGTVDKQQGLISELIDMLRQAMGELEEAGTRLDVLTPTGDNKGLDAPVLGQTDLATFLGVSTSTIDRMTRDGRIMKPTQLSERRKCWTFRQAMAMKQAGLCR